MFYSDRIALRGVAAKIWLCIPLILLASACDSSVIQEAQRAESDGHLINNEAMAEMYPQSFRAGEPQYLERDFEAGANFICDEIKAKHGEDICAEYDINWR